MNNTFEVVANDRAGHAESPLWSAAESALYWVDTRPGTIYRINIATSARTAWDTPARLGAIGLRPPGLIVATKHGIGSHEAVASPSFRDRKLRGSQLSRRSRSISTPV
jgi:sugar lactone lactonase YvrE